MKAANVCLIGLMFVVCASAEPLLEGRVRLESGEPVADAQVRIFDMTDLRQGAIARAQTNGTGYFALPLAALGGRALPARFALDPNYPNPFNPSTIIPYQLAASAAVRLEVFNLLGQRIATLVDGERPAGFHTATWHATDAAGRAVGAGVYLYRMTVGVESQTGRMVLLDGQAGVAAGGSASVWSGVSGGDRSDGTGEQVYGLIVSGEGLVPYVDSSFQVEAGMAPVELVVSAGQHPAGKATDDDLGDLFGAFNEQQEEEEEEAEEEEEDTPEEEGEEDDETSEEEDDAAETDGGRGTGGRDDLIQLFEVSDVSLKAGQSFTMETTVYNPGADPLRTTLYYYRSTDATIDPKTDAFIHQDLGLNVTDLKPAATQTVSLDWTAPPYAGTYYYGACASPSGRLVDLRCSTGVRVTVEGSEGGIPDLVVRVSYVSSNRVTPGGEFSVDFEIENIGTGPAAATTVREYRSNDETIDATDALPWLHPLGGFPKKDRLDVSATSGKSFFRMAPFEAGTYYFALCVDPTIGETNTDNNCSIGVPIIVEEVEGGRPDLIVIGPEILDYRPKTGEFRIWESVQNIGSGPSSQTTVRYYRSDDATIDATDTPTGSEYVGLLPVGGDSANSDYEYTTLLAAPTSPGTYYYGACVDPVPDESDTTNNCSEGVPMNVGVPDLAFGSTWVSTSTPLAGQPFALTTTLRNQGPDEASATTVRYYRSDDAIIDATDTPIGTGAVGSLTAFDGLASGPGSRLAASGISREAIRVSAPSSLGTYYYGACADPVPGETNTDNNCSAGEYVRVVPSGEDPFNIELVFLSDFTDAHKDVMQQAARRWEAIITEGLPDVNFSANPHHSRTYLGETIVNDTVDDLRIFVEEIESGITIAGLGGVSYVRSGNPTGLPATGFVGISKVFLVHGQQRWSLSMAERFLRDVMLHEISHVLGFGPLWSELGLLQELSGDTYFSGELAIQAFDATGGEDYSGNKVPVELGLGESSCGNPSHWRTEVFNGNRRIGAEVKTRWLEFEAAISAITIQSLADLGYVVDVSRADPYRLPALISIAQSPTASAKPVASHDLDLGFLGPIYVGDEQGRIIRTIGD